MEGPWVSSLNVPHGQINSSDILVAQAHRKVERNAISIDKTESIMIHILLLRHQSNDINMRSRLTCLALMLTSGLGLT